MDVAKLGYSYQSTPISTGPAPNKLPDSNPYNLPDLGEPPSSEVRISNDRLDFINPNFSTEKAMISIQVKNAYTFVDGQSQAEGKIRSPYLQQQARDLAKDYIRNPIREAWANREIDTASVMATGVGLGVIAAAVASPSDVRSRITLYKADLGDYQLKQSLSISSGKGEVDARGIKLNLSPKEQGNAQWNVDLEYQKEDNRINLGYNRSVSRVQVGPSTGISHFRASLSNDRQQGTVANLSYHISY